MAGDGVVVRGRAYGVRSIRVDGNDALAMYSAVQVAREMAISEHRPILIEVKYGLVFLVFLAFERHDFESQTLGLKIFDLFFFITGINI